MRCSHASRARIELLEARTLLSDTVIEGVLPVSLDQPRTHLYFTRTPDGQPITNGGIPVSSGGVFDVTAFLDTGSSGLLLSYETADAVLGLDIAHQMVDGLAAKFYDVGVAGFDEFDISEQLYMSLGNFGGPADTAGDPGTWETYYKHDFGPIRTQITLTPVDEFLMEPLDIIGMPGMAGKVVVMDARTIFADETILLSTYMYDPGTPFNPATEHSDPGIPSVSDYIKLSYADMARFTLTDPEGADPPTLAPNPFIGPDPVRRMEDPTFDDGTPPLSFSFGGLTSTGSFLLDTGAAASFMSQARAADVGVHYQDGTYGSDAPVLVDANGDVIPNQFTLTIGGIGGAMNVAGFFLDSMRFQTVDSNGNPRPGHDLVFQGAPVLVIDVTVEDPVTLQTFTLDGDIGMNYFVPTAMPDLSDIHAGAFDWITFDEPNGLLGVNLAQFSLQPPEITGISNDSGIAGDGITTDRTLTISGSSDPDLTISVYLDGDLLGTTTANAFGAWSYDNTAMSLADGTYQLTAQASDGLGGLSPESQPFTVKIDNVAPTITSFTINDGNVQRSMIKTITIVFSEEVSLTNALSLTNRLGVLITGAAPDAPTNPSGDKRTFIVSFSGAKVTGGSLPDGMYKLQVAASGVSDLAGNVQAAGGSVAFHRLFGDSDGDRDVDAVDLLAFKRALRQPLNYVWWLDYNDDTVINNVDYLQFKSRLRIYAR